MPLRIRTASGSEVSLKRVTYALSTRDFEVMADLDAINFVFRTPLQFNDPPEPSNYETFLFKNKFIVESSIFEIHESSCGSRIGWMIPIAALESAAHDKADNKHFLNYAYAGIIQVIEEANITIDRTDIIENGTFALADFFDDSVCVAVLSKSVLQSKLPTFDITLFSPSLFRFGFLPLERSNHPAGIGSATEVAFRSISKKLTIIQISESLKGEQFLLSIFSGLIELKGHSLATFLILYQTLELLIDRIFAVERSNLINKINNIGNSVDEIKNAVTTIRDSISEESRLLSGCALVWL
jgi:hypothetical protein